MRATTYVIQFLSHEDGLWTDRGAEFEAHQRDKAEAHLALERANDPDHQYRLIERIEVVLDPEEGPTVVGFEMDNGEVAYYQV